MSSGYFPLDGPSFTKVKALLCELWVVLPHTHELDGDAGMCLGENESRDNLSRTSLAPSIRQSEGLDRKPCPQQEVSKVKRLFRQRDFRVQPDTVSRTADVQSPAAITAPWHSLQLACS